MTPQELVAAALEARMRAYAPYSHYLVGAAVLTRNGEVVAGCNVGNCYLVTEDGCENLSCNTPLAPLRVKA